MMCNQGFSHTSLGVSQQVLRIANNIEIQSGDAYTKGTVK